MTDQPLPLVQHLIELRDRLLRMLLAVLVVFACLFYFANDIYAFVAAPLQKFLPAGASMIATDVTSPFFTPFKLTLFTSVVLAIPYLLYQIWAFIAPALYKHEKRYAAPLLVASVSLFYAGMAFAYFIVFPLVFGFFTSVGPAGVTVMTDISLYLNFVLKLFFAFGMAFQIPVATVLMISAGMTSVESLTAKRPYIVVGCFVIGMLLTPPDIISQSLLAVPMWLLFESGILVGRLIQKSEKSGAEKAQAKDASSKD